VGYVGILSVFFFISAFLIENSSLTPALALPEEVSERFIIEELHAV
jgi:hypothetical protein